VATITIPINSRYKDTPVFSDNGVVSFELQIPPPEFTVQPAGATKHTVRSFEVGFLDIVAVQYFGAGYEVMWWAIAQANGMIDPEREMYPGQQLVIPPPSAKQSFLGRQGDATQQP
jgi:hypothetical protein